MSADLVGPLVFGVLALLAFAALLGSVLWQQVRGPARDDEFTGGVEREP